MLAGIQRPDWLYVCAGDQMLARQPLPLHIHDNQETKEALY